MLEYDHNVLAEFETIHKLNDPLSTLTLSLHEFFEKSYFNICVVDVKLFVFANFSGHNAFKLVAVIYAFYYLAKSTLVDYPNDLIAIAELLSDLCFIIALFVSDLILILPSYLSYSVNFFEDA